MDDEIRKLELCIDDLGELFQKTARKFRTLEKKYVKEYGLSISQGYVLIDLLKYETLSMNEIGEKMNLDVSTVTRLMNILVRDGYVERVRLEKDRRVVRAELTAKGKEIGESLSRRQKEYYKSIIKKLPKGHVREAMNFFDMLVEAFDTNDNE